MNPRARTQDVEAHWSGEELIVHDLRNDEVHSLPPLVARVWESADGSRSVAELMKLLADGNLEADPETLSRALIQLAAADLMEGITIRSASPSTTRAA